MYLENNADALTILIAYKNFFLSVNDLFDLFR